MIAVPHSKADELASTCLQDDPDAYYRKFEFDAERFPDLLPGEVIRVEYRRIRPPAASIAWTDAHMVGVTA